MYSKIATGANYVISFTHPRNYDTDDFKDFVRENGLTHTLIKEYSKDNKHLEINLYPID